MTEQYPHRVILVDDNALVRKALKLFIRHFIDNITIVGEASTGVEAVQLCLELNPDLVLMDLIMPKMNGIEATRRILQDNPSIKIIGLTSDAENDGLTEQVKSAGAIGCISKQSTLDDIKESLRLHGVLSSTTASAS